MHKKAIPRLRTGISANAFSIKSTFMSGQPLTFHAEYSKGNGKETLEYATSKGVIFLEGTGDERAMSLRYGYSGAYTRAKALKEIRLRFGIDEDMHSIYKGIETDAFISEAISSLYGLRVTQNDPWETTLCFIISQFNNIKRIRGIVQNLRKRYGEVLNTGDYAASLFPLPKSLAKAGLEELSACGAGFRSRYIRNAAIKCSEGWLDDVQGMDYESAKSHLMGLDGVGEKVADCILLFGYKRYEAFPIDVWVKRVMEKRYLNSRRSSMREIRAFARSRWKGLAGYAHEYIYTYGRLRGIGASK